MRWLQVSENALLPLACAQVAPSVVAGSIVNRLNVAVVGISSEHWQTYCPHWMEIVATPDTLLLPLAFLLGLFFS
ncbi:MAG TPA: hypothetical protein VM487_12325 [Phycisphaerae bacterium]|nr:hypothetical protein [Phycisphaerae bacterium]